MTSIGATSMTGPERWPWATVRIGSWLLPSFLALALAGLVAAALVTAAAAVLLGRNPLLPWALVAIGAALFVAQGLRRRRDRGIESHALLPSLLLLLGVWTALLLVVRLPVLPSLDLLSLGLAIQIGFGRLGCTLAGCCYGLPASWGVVHPPACGSPPAGVRRLPVPLLEAGGWLLIALGIALALAVAPSGTAVALLLLLYGTLRSALEPLRGDPVRRWRGLRPAQIQAALCLVAGTVLALASSRRLLPAPLSASGAAAPWGSPGEGVLVVVGLVAALGLVWRRGLWCGGVRRLPDERRQRLEDLGRSLRGQSPSREVQVRPIGDLHLGFSHQGFGPEGEWQISVRRPQPPLSRAEAEWTLEAIASGFHGGRPVSSPLVVGGQEGIFLIALPDPAIPPPASDRALAEAGTLPAFFQPLLPP